ncbi:MAG TPA: hypothetical protein VMY05_09120 [Acidobacteriota bacterium]|nr:hypothetical protein [Acidobacteriota bacterium]
MSVIDIRKSHRRMTAALVGLVVCLVGVVQGEEPADTVGSMPGIEVATSVDVAEIYIGDLITYTISITYDSTYELIPPPLGANLGAFDVKDYEPDVTTKLSDGRNRSVTVFRLTTFTTGDYVIPPMPLLFTLPDSSRKVILAEPVPITVKSLLAEAVDSLDIRPLKAQYEFQRGLNRLYVVLGLALLVLVAGGVLWLVARKRKERRAPVDLRPPWEIALEKMALLQERNLPGSSAFKSYYYELTEIAREYLGRMYRTYVLEMTTEEFLEYFRDVATPDGLRNGMINFLGHADLVKFAKFVPEKLRAESDFQFVHDMIDEVREDYERRQPEEMALGGSSTGRVAVTGGES